MRSRIKARHFIAFMFVLCLVISCGTTSPNQGWVLQMSSQHIPGLNGTTIGNAKLEKRGESCSISILPLNIFYYGHGRSVQKAMQDAGIKKIAVIDYQTFSILPYFGIFSQDCVVVWGE